MERLTSWSWNYRHLEVVCVCWEPNQVLWEWSQCSFLHPCSVRHVQPSSKMYDIDVLVCTLESFSF